MTMETRAIRALFAALLIGQVAVADPGDDRISSRQTGEDSYEITLESTTVFDLASAQNRIVPTAREICGERYIEAGHYSFDMNQAVTGSSSEDTFRLVQNIRCVDSVAARPPSDREPQLDSKAAEEAVLGNVRQLSEDYFERLYADLGDDAAAALAEMRRGQDTESSGRAATAADTAISINLYRLTIYDNLPGAPADGVYVAVDYDNRVGNVAHHCGYLMWHSFDARRFTLGRVESGTVRDDLLATMSVDDAYAIRKKLRCANFYDE